MIPIHNEVGSGKGRRGSENEKVLEKAESDIEIVLTRRTGGVDVNCLNFLSTCRVSSKNKGEGRESGRH